jgi:restriction endonuclease S subunit
VIIILTLISEVTNSELTSRLDAEFYKPIYLETENTLQRLLHRDGFKVLRMQDISSKIRKGIFTIMKTEYRDEGIPFIRVSNIKGLLIERDDLVYISTEKNMKESKTALRSGDIVISKGGTIGEVAIIPPSMPEANVSQDVIAVSLRKSIRPEYVAAYLASKFGKSHFERYRSRQTHPHLELEPVRELLVPIPSSGEQQAIVDLIKEGVIKHEDAIRVYREAQNDLDALLRLPKPEQVQSNSFSIRFSDAENGSGWSAEQYLPEYSRIVESLKQSKIKTVRFKDAITFSRKQIDPRREPDRLFNYVELADVSASFGYIESNSKFLGHAAPSRAKLILSDQDILIPYLSGSFNKVAIVTKEYDGMVSSTGFYVCRSNTFDRWFLLLLLRSSVFQTQLKQRIAGTIMQSISVESLQNVILPVPSKQEQEALGEKMRFVITSEILARASIKEGISKLEGFLKASAEEGT